MSYKEPVIKGKWVNTNEQYPIVLPQDIAYCLMSFVFRLSSYVFRLLSFVFRLMSFVFTMSIPH